MTDYTKIAERIVVQEIGRWCMETGPMLIMGTVALTAEEFCTHPAVVLALMKKAMAQGAFGDEVVPHIYPVNEPLELAIVLACLSALDGDK